MSGYWAGILSILAINIVFAYAIFLPVATGQLNLGGAGFQAIGAYCAAFLSASVGLSVPFTLLAATIMAGIAGAALAFPILRTKGVYLILATYAFAEVVAGLILNSETLGGAIGLSVPGYIEWYVPCIMAGCRPGGKVLDPFGGAGTTGMVADRLGRDAVLIELNPEYAEMARRRIVGDAGMFAEVA